MSAGPDAAPGAGDPDPDDLFPDVASRETILELLEDGIREAHRKVESGRVYDAENERVRQQWIRTLAYAANSYRQLRRDEDLERLAERVEDLEARQEGDR